MTPVNLPDNIAYDYTQVAAPNGHRVSPPHFPVENPVDVNRADLLTDKANISQNQLAPDDQVVERQKDVPITPLLAHEKVEYEKGPVAASAYHVPPKPFTPSPKPYQPGEYTQRAKEMGTLPERCQFMFSDGRQCTMARSEIHPSLCVYHSDREDQLFGDPTHRCEARALDFPELYSACRDLTTARGVNRVLAQVFRLLAQRRISRQEAAAFAKLGQLLLQSISAMRAEGEAARAEALSEFEQHMTPVVEQQNVPITPLLPHNEVEPERAHSASRAVLREISPAPLAAMPEPAPCCEAVSVSSPNNPSSSEKAVAAVSNIKQAQAAASNSCTINTSASRASNSRRINTYEIAGVQPVQNEYLQNAVQDAAAQPPGKISS